MIYEKTEDFYFQKIHMTSVTSDRFEFFENLCRDKKVLHVGCADAMTYGPGHNLHIKLSSVAKELHGIDIDLQDLEKLKAACPGTYFTDISQCTDKYDIVLVPEVLEHVLNAKEFLDQVFAVKSTEYFITVPNIIHYSAEMLQMDTCAMEIVHPDHKYWFSPYTLYNITKPYMKNESDCTMYYLEKKSMVAINIKK